MDLESARWFFQQYILTCLDMVPKTFTNQLIKSISSFCLAYKLNDVFKFEGHEFVCMGVKFFCYLYGFEHGWGFGEDSFIIYV